MGCVWPRGRRITREEIVKPAGTRRTTLTAIAVWSFALIEAAAIGLALWYR